MGQKNKFTIGADPELFLQDQAGHFVSAIGKFGGTKQRPKPLTGIPGCFIQEDNVAVEFNIPPVVTTHAFVKNVRACLSEIEKRAAAFNLKLAIVPAAVFDKAQLNHPNALHFGCDPDFNVWTLAINPPPNTTNKRLRSCGGHIHIGYPGDWVGLGRAMDLFVGCPSIVFDPDKNRRKLYVKAGTVRKKPYGLEWRTASNYWLKSKDLMEMVFSQTLAAIAFVENKREIPVDAGRAIINCINKSDHDLLRKLTVQYNLDY